MLEITLEFSGSLITALTGYGLGVETRILKRFGEDAGMLMIAAVQDLLGHASLYQLNPEYAKRKPSLPGYTAYGGKDPGQPLILTGAMLEAISVVRNGNTLTMFIDTSSMNTTNADQYVNKWLDKTNFLLLGFQEIEPKLPDILLGIIVSEMLF